MKLFINILTLLIVCPGITLGQTYFNMRYPPDPGTWGGWSAGVVFENNQYYFNRSGVGNFGRQFSLSKTDSNGMNLIVLDTVSSDTSAIIDVGVQKTKNGFVDIFTITNVNPHSQQFGVWSYDSLGIVNSVVVDTNTYSYIFIREFIKLPNKELILVGDLREDSSSLNNQKLALIKTDSIGHQIWKKTYKMSSKAWNGHSIALCDDGGFIIGGAEVDYTSNPDFTRPLVMKVDSNGTRVWHQPYGSIQHSSLPAHGIIQTQNGEYVFVGGIGLPYWDGSGDDAFAPWIVGLNSSGGQIWSDTLNPDQATGSYTNYLSDIELLEDGHVIVTGQHKIWNDSNSGMDKWRIHGIIAKYSTFGQQQWLRTYRHPEVPDQSNSDHLLYDIDPTPDGGFVAVGYLIPSIDNTQDTWMIKVDSFGCLTQGCEVTSVPKIESSIAQLKIYPNPATEEVHFDITPTLQKNFGYVLKLYDMVGKLVLTQTLQPYENTISVSHLKVGIYSYRLNETWGQVVIQ